MKPSKPPKPCSSYWDRVRDKAAELGTDGCTGALGIHVDCCLEHDIHCRTGKTLDGKPISVRERHARFRSCLQSRSKLGWFSPMAWWRWAIVSLVKRDKGVSDGVVEKAS